MEKNLQWHRERKEILMKTRVFDVCKVTERSETGVGGDYTVLDSDSWVIVVADAGDDFIMVRQWRHGYSGITAEFPGGCGDGCESVLETAARELLEETGFKAGKLTLLATLSPNPALFSNRVSICLAEDLTDTCEQHPDPDEVINRVRVPKNEVLQSFGTGEYVHSFVGTALALYIRHRGFRF